MKVLGITGGIGAGKSTVLQYLIGKPAVRTLQMDRVGHACLAPSQEGYRSVLKQFGREILQPDGTIDRGRLASIVFENEEKLAQLNAIIHPLVKGEVCKEIAQARKEGVCCFVLETALLIEAEYSEICDEVWYIYTEEPVRRQRLRLDRGYSDEKITAILGNQMQDAAFRQHCDVVIDNSSEDVSRMYRQVDAAFQRLFIPTEI